MISDVYGTNKMFDYGENPEDFDVYAEDQCWDEETKKQLWDNYKIIYTGGATPVMLVEHKSNDYGGHLNGKYFVLGGEDDGHIFFRRTHGQFNLIRAMSWVDDVIDTLQRLKDKCKEGDA